MIQSDTHFPEEYNHPEGVEIPKGGAGAANFRKHGEDENNSIGSGSADQGIDAENAEKEDDIRAVEQAELNRKKNDQFTVGKRSDRHSEPTHGLVEEGPGPDA